MATLQRETPWLVCIGKKAWDWDRTDAIHYHSFLAPICTLSKSTLRPLSLHRIKVYLGFDQLNEFYPV